MKIPRKVLAYVILTVAMVFIGVKVYMKEFPEIDDKVLQEELKIVGMVETGKGEEIEEEVVEKNIFTRLGLEYEIPSGYVCVNFQARKVKRTSVIFLGLRGREGNFVMALYKTRRRGKEGFLSTAKHIYGERGKYSFFIFDGSDKIRIAILSDLEVEKLYQIVRSDFLPNM